MFDIIGKRRWFFAFSLAILIPGLAFIVMTPLSGGKVGLQFSIDYTGGTTWAIKFDDPSVTDSQVQAVFVQHGLPDTVVIKENNGFFDIRTEPVGLNPVPSPSPSPSPTAGASASPGSSASPSTSASPSASGSAAATASAGASPAASPSPSSAPSPSPSPNPSASPSPSPSPSPSSSASAGAVASPGSSPGTTGATTTGNSQIPTTGVLGEIATSLQQQYGPFQQASLTTIGPVVSSDLIQQAIILILIGSLGILTWITVRFRDVKFGVTALMALIHDVIVVVGAFAILGTFFAVQIDALFVTAMLTVIGFSVHDTIVVYDRVRENKARHAGEPFDQIVNHSLLQTLGRSIMTSFTVVLTLLSLLLFGGPAIRYFILALLIGITSGTYSSIFNASPLLVVWQQWEDRRRGRLASARSQRRTAS